MAYLHSESITIDHTKCGSADSSSFPVLFSSTIANLKTVGNSGEVTNANGYDIIFSSAASDYTGASKLDFEIESYNAATGEFIAWVRVPTLSHTSDTVIYLVWGNALISTSQENKTGVWDSNFKAVYHLADNAANTTIVDSTTNANNMVNDNNTSGKTATAQIGKGMTYANSASDWSRLTTNPVDLTTQQVTVSLWYKPTQTASQQGVWTFNDNQAPTSGTTMALMQNNAGTLQMFVNGYTTIQTIVSGTWYYITAVMNIGSSTTSVYVNGAFVTTVSGGAANSQATFYLGSGFPANGDSIDDETRISNTNRSASWILSEYNNQNSPSTFYTLGSEQNAGGGSVNSNFLMFM